MELANVVNVALLPEGETVARDNMNVVCLMSIEAPLNTAERYRAYRSIKAVENDFGTYSKTYAFASVFFQQLPNAVNAGGALIIGHHRAVDESVSATAGLLVGVQLDEADVISRLQGITDGSFKIAIDGWSVIATGLDFSTTTNINEVAVTIANATAGAVCSFSDQRLILTSETTGVNSTMSLLETHTVGTFIGSILGLSDGANVNNGSDAEVAPAESKLDAVGAVRGMVNFKGVAFIEATTDTDSENLADWCQTNGVMGYDVFTSITNLEVDNSNPVWRIKLKGQDAYRMFYGTDRKLAVGIMSRLHTVNFNAENSANTLNLKEIRGIVAVDHSQTVWDKCNTVGLSIYTVFKGVPKMLTSGANGWADDAYNLIAYIDAIQVDMFNLLGGTATKVPQTDRGVDQLIDQAGKTTRGFVRAGVIAPGTWSSPDYFGDKDTFDRNILNSGFYWLAGRLEDQPQGDRQERKSPPLQGAIKNAGAIHSAETIINFNY